MKIEPKNTLNKIRVLLNKDLKLAQMKLDDGVTVIEAEEFKPEYSVGIVAEDGIVALEVGTYTLEDGQVLTVEEAGVIATIGEAVKEEPAPEAEMETEKPAEATAKKVVESVTKETFFSKEEAETLLSKIEELELSNEAKNAEIETLKNDLELAQTPKKTVHNPENKEVKFSIAGKESLVEYLNNNIK